MMRGKITTTNTAFITNAGVTIDTRNTLLPPLLPQHYIDQPVIIAQLCNALLNPAHHVQDQTTVLYGSPGSGKSTLAAALCHTISIQEAYPDGIFWINAGPKPYDLPAQINLLGSAVDSAWVPITSTAQAAERLKHLLSTRAMFVIIDDVCTVRQALELKPGGAKTTSTTENAEKPASHVLFTTRNQKIAEAIRATRIPANGFTPKSSIDYLNAYAAVHEATANFLANEFSYSPYCLTLAGLIIQQGENASALLENVKADQPSSLISYLIDKHLEKMEPAKRLLTASLSILPARIPIPLSAVHLLWHKLEQTSGKINHLGLIDELVDMGLMSRQQTGNKVTLNDHLAFATEEKYEDEIKEWHEALLTAYNRDDRFWPELPDDGYLFRFLCYHLSASQQAESLPNLLLSYEWLQAKLNFTDVDALIDDFNFAREDKTVRVVQEALRLSSAILTHDPNQLGSQLIGRLQELQIPALRDLVDAIRLAGKPEAVWLDPIKVNLGIPGSALLQTYRGHEDVIHAIDIEMEGQRAVSASSDRTLKLWDLRTGAQLRTFKGHRDLVHTVAFTPNGRNIISGSDDLLLKVWDVEHGTNLKSYMLHEEKILAIMPLRDNQRVLSSDEAGKLLLWDLWSGEIIFDLKTQGGRIWSIALTPERNVAFTAGDDQTIKCWNLDNGAAGPLLAAHDDWIWSLKVTPDGRYLISASEDQSIIVWDLQTGQVARVLTGHQAGVRAIDLSRDGKTLVSASEDQSMIVWDFEKGEILRTFTGHDDWVWDMAITPDGKGVLSASDDSSLKLWSLTGHTCQIEKEAHQKGVRALAISPDNTFLLSASDDASIMKWRLDRTKVTSVLRGHSDWVWDVAITSNGTQAVSTSFDCSINIWDLKMDARKHILNGHDDWVWCVALSWNSKFMVSGSEDKTIGVWDVANGRLLKKLYGHTAGVTAVVISNDNRLAISASMDHTLRVWRLEDGQLLHVMKGHTGPVRSLLISQLDQRILSSSDDGTIRIWNFNHGFESCRLEGHTGPVRHLALAPMGYVLVSAGEDKVIRIWDLSTDEVIFELAGHTKDIRQIAISRDGRLIASAGDDHALFLWNIEEGKRISSFYADHPLTRCIFTVDGHRVVAGDAGGGVHFLRMDDLGFVG